MSMLDSMSLYSSIVQNIKIAKRKRSNTSSMNWSIMSDEYWLC